MRQARIYGVRPERSFREAANRFVDENGHKRSLDRDICILNQMMPFIGDLPLHRVHRGTLEPYIDYKKKEGKSTRDNKPRAQARTAHPETRRT